MRTSFFIALFLFLSSCTSNSDVKNDSTTQDSAKEPKFQILFEDSIGYGCRGMEVFEDEVYFSGIKGTCFKLNQNYEVEHLIAMENDSLDFRDLTVINKDHFFIINSGLNKAYVLEYKQGKTDTSYHAEYDGAFLDDLIQDANGFIYCLGDPDALYNQLFLIRSHDQGRTWQRIFSEVTLPKGEFFFAASGTCMAFMGKTLYLAVGGSDSYLMEINLKRHDVTRQASKISFGESAGMNSLICVDESLYAVGGDYTHPDDSSVTFQKFGEDGFAGATGGYQSSITKNKELLVCTGRNGSWYSVNEGKDWTQFTKEGFYKVILTSDNKLFCSGKDGRIIVYGIE
ncbi:MAG: hypothetical protein R2799_01760 [Crocinitomicaceae bacterium]